MFTSTSTVVFKTFACDESAVEGKSYLRADYSISCDTNLHTFFKVYSGLMIVVSSPVCLMSWPWACGVSYLGLRSRYNSGKT